MDCKSDTVYDMMRCRQRKGAMLMGNVIVLLIVVGAVVLAVRSMIRDKKKGKSLQCGGDCKHCSGCH